jgi:three-Cys-motif partner protein
MPTQSAFSHAGTEKKLQAVQAYLERYLLVFSKQPHMETIYIDAFAGSGTIPFTKSGGLLDTVIDVDEFLIGSALRAINLSRKFSRYVFIEENQNKLNDLENVIKQQPNPPKNVEYICGDANEGLLKKCLHLSKSNVRAVVFLDPFGNQVNWLTLEALAKTRHVDLWYLFPSMLGVYRQIGNTNAKMTQEQEGSLNRLFGPHDWRTAFIKKVAKLDLFGPTESDAKVADVNDITRFKIECLQKIFEGGVLEKRMPLGRNNAHWYSLIFAMANPSGNAKKAGHAIANHIMTNS